jgi:type IV pilus assembly protein PilM
MERTSMHKAVRHQKLLLGARLALGIDIGSSAVKWALLRRSRKGIELLHFGIQENDPGQGRPSPHVLAERLRKITSKKINASLGAQSRAVAVRYLELPDMSEREFEDAAVWEAKSQIFWDEEDSVIAALSHGRIVTDEGPKRVGVFVAAEKKRLAELEWFGKQAGLQLKGIYATAWPLGEALGTALGESHDLTSVLDIGANSAKLAVFDQRQVVFVRDLETPESGLFRDLVEFEGLSEKEAESVKRQVSLPLEWTDLGFLLNTEDPQAKTRADQLQTSLEVLANDIRQSFQFLATQTGRQPARLILTGGGALRPGLAEHLESQLDIPVMVGDALAGVQTAATLTDESQRVAPRLSVAIGLALGELEHAPWQKLNLIGRESKTGGRWSRHIAVAAVVISLLGIALPLGYFNAGFEEESPATSVVPQAQASDQIQTPPPAPTEPSAVQRRPRLSKVLTALAQGLPPDAQLLQISFKPDGAPAAAAVGAPAEPAGSGTDFDLILRGKARSTRSLHQLFAALRESSVFESIELLKVESTPTGQGIEFRMDAKVRFKAGDA